MFTGRSNIYDTSPSFHSRREGPISPPQQQKRPFQRYSISPVRNNRPSRSPVTLYADAIEHGGRGRQQEAYNNRNGRHRRSNSPPSRRQSRSPLFVGGRRSRSRSFDRIPQQRGRAVSPRRRSRSPHMNRGARFPHSKSRSPIRNWRQQNMSPIRTGYRSRSPLPVGLPSRDAYAYDRRSHSRSGSNMEISSTEESPFRNTFRPVESKKTKKIKISVPKDLPREEESSPEIVEIDYRGYKIRNAPEINSGDSKRKSRWDTNQEAFSIPSTKEILEKQGIANPDEALKKIADLPTMESRFKSKHNDEDAIQEQLRLLEQQSKFEEIRKNLPPSVALPSSLAFSAIGKAGVKNSSSVAAPSVALSKPVVTISRVIPSANVPTTFPPPGFPSIPVSLPGGATMLPPPIGMPPNFNGPPPTGLLPIPPTSMPIPFGLPPPHFTVPSMGMPNFSAPPPIGLVNPPASAAMQFPGMPQIAAQPQMDQTELVFRARADIYRRDLRDIHSIPELMKYMWSQGYDAIAADDPPLLFNEVLKDREGVLGASVLYQIICYGHPELETYYCGMCNHWTTVSEMFNHLTASMHRINFLSRNYKLFHQRAEGYEDLAERDRFLDLICKRVWKIEGSGACVNRMRCILNIDAIKQVWPNYMEYIDNSWKMLGSNDGISGILDNPQISQLDEQPVAPITQTEIQYPGSSTKGRIQIKPSVNTILSRGPIGELERVTERHESKERRRSRSRSRDRFKKKSRTSRRSRSPARREIRRSPSPRRSSKDNKNDWDRKAADFLARIENDSISATLNSMSAAVANQARDELESNRAHMRRKETLDSEQEKARLTRKALAILVELQQLYEEKGSIKKSMIYAIAEEMGLDREEVRQSKILKQGLENMRVVDDMSGDQQKLVSLESLGIDSSNLSKLLSSVSSKNEDPSMMYPEVDSESKLASSLRVAIAEIEHKLREPKNASMYGELRQRLNHLQIKLSQELGVDPVRRVPPNAPMVRPRPMGPASGSKAPLPGAWRTAIVRDPAQSAALRVRREDERPAPREEHRFDSGKVEREWTEYFMKDPSKIDELTDTVDKQAETQYDKFYGPGTYVAFCAAKKRAAANAKKTLSGRTKTKPYFEDFNS